jgi:hypothetical protein
MTAAGSIKMCPTQENKKMKIMNFSLRRAKIINK